MYRVASRGREGGKQAAEQNLRRIRKNRADRRSSRQGSRHLTLFAGKEAAMHFKAGKRDYSPLVKISLALVLALAMAAVGTASVNTPGVTAFLELDFPANVGFDNLPGGFLFDWAKAGANPGACSEAGGTVTCSGSGGGFDGGTFNGPTTPPTAPTTTAAATADTSIVAASFGADPLSVDVTACGGGDIRSEEHTSELQSRLHLVCRLLLDKKKPNKDDISNVYAI